MGDTVMVVGNGGREHAIAWKLSLSPHVAQVLCAPGNPGTAGEPGIRNIAADPKDLDGIVTLAKEQKVQLVVIGPEAPLVAGLADRLTEAGIAVLGPGSAGARLEGSKAFAKDFMIRHNIPTASYQTFEDLTQAQEYIRAQAMPIVIKEDGLAAGKGVVIAQTSEEACTVAAEALAKGGKIVVEEFLSGEEASFIALVSDGVVVPLASSQDHKRLLDDDQGPNTGGMGAYSPAPVAEGSMFQRILEEVIHPTVAGLQQDGTPFRGFIYAGLMISPEGAKVLEYNCRLGDPETQPLLFRLQSDLYPLLLAAAKGRLQEAAEVVWDARPALCVVLAAHGYPQGPRKGDPIQGLPNPANEGQESKVFHAGSTEREGHIVTSGGRVLGVTTMGATLAEAKVRAYETIGHISFAGMQYRSDIGNKAL